MLPAVSGAIRSSSAFGVLDARSPPADWHIVRAAAQVRLVVQTQYARELRM